MKQNKRLLACLATVVFSGSAFAAVSSEEAKQLGSTLTPFGAEKAGNKEGTIPAYTGEPVKKPASYDPADPGQHPDPFGEKPLFSITAQNYTKYADKLDGSVEMFKKFPNYRMDVYPTHRNFVYPKYVLDNSVKNATSCKATTGEQRLEGCYGGLPFPIPKTGTEMMWNHLLNFNARYWGGRVANYITPTNGNPVLQVKTLVAQSNSSYYDPARTTPLPSNITFYKVRTADTAPARQAGGSTVLLDPLDYTTGGRRAYQYIPGQRRVKLAPDLAYDTPSPYSGGSNTMDDQNVFQGALDRFDFKLIGKKEKYIPYNNYAMMDRKTCPAEKQFSSKNFPLPDCVRWELHRVWVVEATLKPGFRHIYKKRVFFWDEDAPSTGVAENYDAAGALYRVVNGGVVPFYEAPGGVGGGVLFFNTDLTTGVVGSGGLGSCEEKGCGYTTTADRPDSYFQPDAMAGEGVR